MTEELTYHGPLYNLYFDIIDIKEGDQIGFDFTTDWVTTEKIDDCLTRSVSESNIKPLTFSHGTFPQIYADDRNLFKEKSVKKRLILYFRPKIMEGKSKIDLKINRVL